MMVQRNENEEINISPYFWVFVHNTISLNQDDLMSTHEYQYLSQANSFQKKMVIDFNYVWDDEADIVLLNFPEDALSHFDSYSLQFVYNDVHDLFMCIYEIYEKISSIGIYSLDEDVYNCSQKYAHKLELLSKCIEKINLFIYTNNQLERLFNFKI